VLFSTIRDNRVVSVIRSECCLRSRKSDLVSSRIAAPLGKKHLFPLSAGGDEDPVSRVCLRL
jgi:hypothetical protein